MSHLRMTTEQVQERAKRLARQSGERLATHASPKPKKPAKSPKNTSLTEPSYPFQLNAQAKAAGFPVFTPEYRFDAVRKWRFDLAWPQRLVAFEVDGGVWSQGRHTRGSGFVRDMEKLNAATQQGWRVIRVTPQQVKNGEALKLVEWAVNHWL